jgi:hypothetical protein
MVFVEDDGKEVGKNKWNVSEKVKKKINGHGLQYQYLPQYYYVDDETEGKDLTYQFQFQDIKWQNKLEISSDNMDIINLEYKIPTEHVQLVLMNYAKMMVSKFGVLVARSIEETHGETVWARLDLLLSVERSNSTNFDGLKNETESYDVLHNDVDINFKFCNGAVYVETVEGYIEYKFYVNEIQSY